MSPACETSIACVRSYITQLRLSSPKEESSVTTHAQDSNINVATTNHIKRFCRVCQTPSSDILFIIEKLDPPKTDAPGSKVTVSLPALMMSLAEESTLSSCKVR